MIAGIRDPKVALRVERQTRGADISSGTKRQRSLVQSELIIAIGIEAGLTNYQVGNFHVIGGPKRLWKTEDSVVTKIGDIEVSL